MGAGFRTVVRFLRTLFFGHGRASEKFAHQLCINFLRNSAPLSFPPCDRRREGGFPRGVVVFGPDSSSYRGHTRPRSFRAHGVVLVRATVVASGAGSRATARGGRLLRRPSVGRPSVGRLLRRPSVGRPSVGRPSVGRPSVRLPRLARLVLVPVRVFASRGVVASLPSPRPRVPRHRRRRDGRARREIHEDRG